MRLLFSSQSDLKKLLHGVSSVLTSFCPIPIDCLETESDGSPEKRYHTCFSFCLLLVSFCLFELCLFEFFVPLQSAFSSWTKLLKTSPHYTLSKPNFVNSEVKNPFLSPRMMTLTFAIFVSVRRKRRGRRGNAT